MEFETPQQEDPVTVPIRLIILECSGLIIMRIYIYIFFFFLGGGYLL